MPLRLRSFGFMARIGQARGQFTIESIGGLDMPIERTDWEMHIVRKSEQRRGSRRRTVGTYKVFHDGQPVSGLLGMVAESPGPGDNSRPNNGKRIEEGRYPLLTQDGGKYATIGYTSNRNPAALRRPGIELDKTENRTEILIHPARGFLWSIGCINPCTSLPDEDEDIEFDGSRNRVIALIDDLKSYLGKSFPTQNGRKIPRAFVVIDGEPGA
jgi:hypothetical protein